MEYSDEILEHYFNPHNVGKLDENDVDVGACVAGNPGCGLIMRLHIRVSEDKIIQDAKFKAYGCGCTIACASLLTEILVGKSLDSAREINSDMIAKKLGLSFDKMHCSVLAEDVLKKAILNYFEKQEKYLEVESQLV